MTKIAPEIIMVNAASKALEYLNKRPKAENEEIMKHVILSFGADLKQNLRILGVAAANEVLKLKREFPNALDKEILQKLTNNISKIIETAGE